MSNKYNPYYGNIMSTKLPHASKKISILLALSAILMLLLASPVLPLPNLLLQPVQASTTIRGVQTQTPVNGTLSCGGGGANPIDAKITFKAQGTSIDNEWWTLNNGTFQLTDGSDGQTLDSGNRASRYISVNNKGNAQIEAGYIIDGSTLLCGDNPSTISASTSCNDESETISIYLGVGGSSIGNFPNGVIDCGVFGDGDTTAQPSPSPSMTGTTTQDRGSDSNSNRDSDGVGDGIPDSSDRRLYTSNPDALNKLHSV